MTVSKGISSDMGLITEVCLKTRTSDRVPDGTVAAQQRNGLVDGVISGPTDEPIGGIELHLQRVAGLEVRSDDAADRRSEMRRSSESKHLTDVLVGCHVRNERVRILLASEATFDGVIVGVGSDAFSMAAAPDGIRHDIPLSGVVAVEPKGSMGAPRPQADHDAITSFATRLHHLQALERDVVVHTAVGRDYQGNISVVAPDHVVVGGVMVANAHIETVEAPPLPQRRVGHQ
ncbi:MAG: hypothetical protein GEU79_09190 [Acidimicrobiia bacterium]|nr:hypothetical protein [Acidimicrobiia bacterium]